MVLQPYAQENHENKWYHCPICGKKSTHEWYNCLTDSCFRRCACCDDFDGYCSKTHNGARLGWNEAVENYNKLQSFDDGGQ